MLEKLATNVLMLGATVLLLTSSALAQTKPQVDLVLEVVKDPTGVTPPGSEGTLTFTITNLGPDAAGTIPPGTSIPIAVLADALPFEFGVGPPLNFSAANDPDCFIATSIPDPAPGAELEISFFFFIQVLQPGESVMCTLDVDVSPSATENIVNRWTVRSSNDEDLDPSNDDVTILFDLGLAPPIPTLSPVGLTILALALVGAFAVLRRRRGLG